MKYTYWMAAAGLFLAACSSNDNERKLPIYGERTAVKTTVDGKEKTDTLYQTIPSFRFADQDGDTTTNQTFEGKVYVADFFFTSCPSICPIMSRNMKTLYDTFKDNDQVRFLSHSIDPRHDSVPALKEYAQKLGVNDRRWLFVTGPKEVIYPLAEKNYLVAVNEDGKAPGGFVHQGYFVLVDKKKRIRGAYDGTDKTQVQKLGEDIGLLLSEKE
ncbi:MAG: SCO family protein [Mucilaginibacter polytrichastri]|nr:SCO family protein [Mucilaginibacter polytrichastri]